jgi:hypothetical protein
LPLIEAFALFRCLVGGELVYVAEELRHLYEISAWLPVFPANFASREESSKIKGKEKETFTVLLQKTTLWVELSFLSLLLYLQSLLILNLPHPFPFFLQALVGWNSRLFFTFFINLVFLGRD